MYGAIKIVLVTDQALLAEGVRSVFEKTTHSRVVAVYRDVQALFERLLLLSVSIVLIDIGPEQSLELPANLVKLVPECKLILLSRRTGPELTYRAQEIGAAGLLSTSCPIETLVESVHHIARGQRHFECATSVEQNPAVVVQLSQREAELLALIAQGWKNKEIANSLNITEGTVKVYLSKLFKKLEVKDRYELALIGLRNDLNQRGQSTVTRVLRSPKEPLALVSGPSDLHHERATFEHLTA
jgi:DNA-binding NarL/FixJ family response regulator